VESLEGDLFSELRSEAPKTNGGIDSCLPVNSIKAAR
jgi:hypothetical protein